MSKTTRLVLVTNLALIMVTLIASDPAASQEEIGALYGSITDTNGAVLPGVTVTLRGMGGKRLQTSDTQGNFRFLRLDPGLFDLQAELDGFSPVASPGILVRAGRNTTMQLLLDAAIQDVVTVTAETPLLDERQLIQGTSVNQVSLEQIPTTRDPWALLVFAPGVMTDRIDIGGTRTQQSNYTAPGVPYWQGKFVLDGADVTGPVGGDSSTYYDFDQFEQIDVSTGGNDITKRTAGASISLVTKRGTNELRGSARYLLTDDDLFWFFKESDPDVDQGDFPPDQGSVATTQLDSIANYGVELGGPLLTDRLWLWGAYGHNDTDEIKVGGYPQNSTLESVALKLNAQVSQANSLVTSWNETEKQIGDRGAGPGTVWESTWLQQVPSSLLKLEDSHVFTSSLFLTGAWNKLDVDWSLIPNGCAATGGCGIDQEMLLDEDGVTKNSNAVLYQEAPADEFKIDGSYFFGSRQTSHELRFGASYRENETHEVVEYPGGRNLYHWAGEYFFGEGGAGLHFFSAARGSGEDYTQMDRALWIQDTLSWEAWTVNLGLRYDRSDGINNPLIIEANPAFPEVLPEIEFAGNEAGGIDWQTISPRVGVTYALGEERKTLVRASYARFAQALTWQEFARMHPASLVYATFLFTDANGDNMWQESETILEPAPIFTWGDWDPENPTAFDTPNRTDPKLEPDTTDEVILGLQHAFLPQLVAGLDLTWRKRSDIHDKWRLVQECGTEGCNAVNERVARREDYVYDSSVDVRLPDGRPYTVDFFRLGSGLDWTGGNLLTNGDRQVEYLGATLSITKRLANRWMLNGFLNWGRPEWDIPPSFFALDDPTDASPFVTESTSSTTMVDNDGQVFAPGAGRTRGLSMQSSWSFNLNGLVQIVPERWWGFDLAGSVYGREGYPRPLETRTFIPGQGRKTAQAVADPEEFRYDDVYTFDLSFQKEIVATGNLSLGLIVDLFNVFNSGVVLERNNLLNGPLENFVTETLSPRIWRLGLRVNWR